MDTLQVAKDLESAGFTESQSEGFARVLQAMNDGLVENMVTKEYFHEHLSAQLANQQLEIISELWMVAGVMVAASSLLVSLIFFGTKWMAERIGNGSRQSSAAPNTQKLQPDL